MAEPKQKPIVFDPKAPEPVVWRGINVNQPEVNEEITTFHQRVKDAGQLTWMKQWGEALHTEVTTGFKQAVPDFDGLKHVPKGYEQLADAFANATSPEEVESIRQHVDRNLAARRRRMKETFGTVLMDDLVVSVFDPSNLVPLGAPAQGALKGALHGGASVGALVGVTSALGVHSDPTATTEEGVVGTAMGTVLGAGLGAVGGAVGRRVASPSVRTRLALPGGPGRIVSGFGERHAPKAGASTNHGGIDIAYPVGTPLKAQADGKVVKVTTTRLGGNEVHIDYGGGVKVKMLHLNDATVKEGQLVREGQLFGHSGRTGNVTGPHLHMAVEVNGKKVDPMGRIELGFRPADYGAAVDATHGVAIPESVPVFGKDIPVVMERGSGEEVRIHQQRLDDVIDRSIDSIERDTGREMDASTRAIQAYLKDGGEVTRVKRGRRAIDPRKWNDGPDLEIKGVGRDPTMVKPGDLQMAIGRISGRIAEILNHPRLRMDELADEDWIRRLAPDLAKVPEAKRDARWRARAPKVQDVVNALHGRLEELRGHLTNSDSPLVHEAELHAQARYTEKLDEGDLEIMAQNREQQRVQRDDGTIREIRADRPLTAAERRRGRILPPTAAEQEMTDADTVLARLSIDPDAIRDGFLTQKWVGEPLPGGLAMDVEALGSHADYFNFVVNREIAREELAAEAKGGVGVDELLARANERALQEVREGRGLFVPDGNALKRSVLAYTPMEQMHRLVPEDAEIQRALYRLAGDGGTMLTANRLGLPAIEGGSVFQRKDMWVGKLYDVTSAADRAWLKSIGRDGERGRGGTIVAKTMNRLTHWGEKGYDNFWTQIGRAIVGFEDVKPEATEAAQAWFKVMQGVEKEARSLGLFTSMEDGAKAVKQAELRVANLQKKVKEMEDRGFGASSVEQLLDEHQSLHEKMRDIAQGRSEGDDVLMGDELAHANQQADEALKPLKQRIQQIESELRAQGQEPPDAMTMRSKAGDVTIEGKDRRERSQNATAYLERHTKEGSMQSVRPHPEEEPDYFRFRYVSKDGKTAVNGKYTFDGEHIDNLDIGDTNNPVDLGTSDVRNLVKQLRVRHPEATKISAYRMTGARKAAGEGPEFVSFDLPGRTDPLAMMRKLLADAEDQVAKLRELADSPIGHKNEPGHFSRLWNKGALAKEPDRAKAMLEAAYKRDQHPSPRLAAEEAYELLMANNEGELVAPGTPGFLKVRSIPATNKEAWDFIVQDPRVVGAIYLRRMGSAIEMTRTFGDSFGLAEIDRLTLDLVQRGVPDDKIEKAIQLFEDQRDRIVGGFHGKDPLSWDNRTARAIRNFTQLELMGGSPKSQLSDFARIILTQGVGLRHQLLGKSDADAGLIGGIMAHVKGDLDKFHPGGPAKEAGEALDLVIAQAAAKLVEADDALVVTRQTGLERVLAAAVPRFHILSLLTPLTVIMKEWAGVAAASNLIRDAKKVAAGEASDRLIAQLAQKGLSPEMATVIAGMPTEVGASGLHLANTTAWLDKEGGPQAAAAFRAAVNAEIRRAVITPGPLDKPAIADGIVHTKKGREIAQADLDAKTVEVVRLKGELASLHDLPDGHPAKQEAIEKLSEAAGELTQMRRNRGRAGRMEAPLATLPFQLRSYGLAAAPKGIHGLLTGSDRRRITGVLALLAAGYVSYAWKLGWNLSNVDLDEQVQGMIDNSGLLAVYGDVAKSIDTLFSSLTGGVLPQTEAEDGAWDEAGAIAPSAAAFERLYRPFVETGDDQAHAIRKMIPLQNAVWTKWALDALEDAYDDKLGGGGFSGGGDGAPFTHFAEQQPQRTGNGLDRGIVPAEAPPPPPHPGEILKAPKVIADVDAVLAQQRAEGRPRNFTEDPSVLDDLDTILPLLSRDQRMTVAKRAKVAAKKAAKAKRGPAKRRSQLTDVTFR